MKDFNEYLEMINKASQTINIDELENFRKSILISSLKNIPILVCGNGGSASISEHMSCDHTKGVRHDTDLEPNVISLSSNLALITAIANDYSYDQIFSKQIEWFQNKNATLVAISSSGNSPNIIGALKSARAKGYTTASLVGFDGGLVKKENLSDIVVHVKSNNYGIVEDLHQMLMHYLSQSIRSSCARSGHIPKL